ncbi:MAG: rhodanese-like domain-containing protein [Patescibacteria group bacterium]|nr:rhodanese-like domain-containing protein [Patescibacteria group bacterium]
MFDFLYPKVPTVQPEDVKQAIDKKEKCLLLDVRTEAEFAKNRLPNSLNIPLDQIADTILAKVPDKTVKIYAYCLSGSRSVFAVETMVRFGYTNIYDMKQGLLGWRTKKFPIVT